MKLLIAIPALNEEQSIRGTITRCLNARDKIVGNSPVTDVEITVVSDGSTDHTVERSGEFRSLINLIEFAENQGYGAAIMEAWERSDADLLGFLDADGTCDPEFFAPLCRQLVDQDADVILGCRLNKDSRMPWIRRAGNRVFAWVLSAFSPETVKDTASGMRVVRRSALRHLFPLPAGLHFTPAMSARAMLSDATRIVEIDMPYAGREGRSKLRVIGDGLRFLRVIAESVLLYKPGTVLMSASALCVAAAGALMLGPARFYLQTETVAEWMIYRFLATSLAVQIALVLWAASVVSTRIIAISLHEEVRAGRPPYAAWLRTHWFWEASAVLLLTGTILIWPGAVELWNTGHTAVHWSHFVVAMSSFAATAMIAMVRGIDRVLDLAEQRVEYLRQSHE